MAMNCCCCRKPRASANHQSLGINEKLCKCSLEERVTLSFLRNTKILLFNCDTVKYLGVTISSSFDFKEHFNNLCSKVAQRIYILRTVRPLVSRNDLYRIFEGLVVSLLMYSAPLFVGLDSSNYKIINRVLRRCHYVICDCSVNDCAFIYDIRSQIERYAIKFFSNCENNTNHPLHCQIPHRLPHSNKYFCEFPRTSRRLNSFFLESL